MNIATISVTSSPQQIFQTPYNGYYKLFIEEEAGYSGAVDILDHGTSGNIITENVDFRGFIRFSRYIDTTTSNGNFTFDNIRVYCITKVGDLFYIQTLSGANINVTFRCAKKQLTNQILVGPEGDFTTLKSAVDWFNLHAINITQILLDGGSHLINDTILINNPTHKLSIAGLSYIASILEATTGLTGKPMFEIRSGCDISHFGAVGTSTSFPSYGTNVGENFINFTTNSENYCEIVDYTIDGFYTGFNDTIGVSFFCLNFIIYNCSHAGVEVNYITDIPEQSIDLEVGNIDGCTIGINLVKTGTLLATKQSFILTTLIFSNYNSTDIGIKYNGTTYNYGVYANITNCSYNYTGEFVNGFDFTIPRDADVEIIGNNGLEDKTPFTKISVIANTTTTTLLTPNIFYAGVFTNNYMITCKLGIVSNLLTYYPTHIRNLALFLSGDIQCDTTNRTITVAIRRQLLNITSVLVSGTTVTVTTSIPHGLYPRMIIQALGWTIASINSDTVGNSGLPNGIPFKIATTTPPYQFTYLTNLSGTGSATAGTIGILLGSTAVRITTASQPFQYSTNVYIQSITSNDTLQLYISNSGTGVVIIQDINFLVKV